MKFLVYPCLLITMSLTAVSCAEGTADAGSDEDNIEQTSTNSTTIPSDPKVAGKDFARRIVEAAKNDDLKEMDNIYGLYYKNIIDRELDNSWLKTFSQTIDEEINSNSQAKHALSEFNDKYDDVIMKMENIRRLVNYIQSVFD